MLIVCFISVSVVFCSRAPTMWRCLLPIRKMPGRCVGVKSLTFNYVYLLHSEFSVSIVLRFCPVCSQTVNGDNEPICCPEKNSICCCAARMWTRTFQWVCFPSVISDVSVRHLVFLLRLRFRRFEFHTFPHTKKCPVPSAACIVFDGCRPRSRVCRRCRCRRRRRQQWRGGVSLSPFASLRHRNHVKTNDKSINKIYQETILAQRAWQHRGRSSNENCDHSTSTDSLGSSLAFCSLPSCVTLFGDDVHFSNRLLPKSVEKIHAHPVSQNTIWWSSVVGTEGARATGEMWIDTKPFRRWVACVNVCVFWIIIISESNTRRHSHHTLPVPRIDAVAA